METAQENLDRQQYEEMKKVASDNVCAVCGGELSIHTNPEKKTLEVSCLSQDHHGFQERESYTQMMRRGATAPDILVEQLKKRLLPQDMTPEDFTRTLSKIQVKYPDIGRDLPTASLFLLDAIRLNLDPLLGEIIPLVFNKNKPKPTVVPFVTEHGELSGAARACPDEWNGPPTVMPLQDYLLTLEHLKNRPLSEIKELVEDTAENLCNDRKARVWVALGKRRSDTTETKDLPPCYGWFSTADLEDATKKEKPSANMPGNQARIRAVRRWAQEVYPEWRQKMIVLTGEWRQRSNGVVEAERLIEGEYKFIEQKTSSSQPPQTQKAPAATKPPNSVTKPASSGTKPVEKRTIEGQVVNPPGEPGDEIFPENEVGAGGEILMTEEEQNIAQGRAMIMELVQKLNKKLDARNQRIWPIKVLMEKINVYCDPPVDKLGDIPDDKVNKVANLLADLDLISKDN